MATGRLTLMDPPIEDLLDKVDSKFTLVALGALRARQVNAYYNSLGEGLGRVVPPQVASVSGKPLSIAFEEIAASKATFTRVDPEELAAAELAAAELAELAELEAAAAAELSALDGGLAESAEAVPVIGELQPTEVVEPNEVVETTDAAEPTGVAETTDVAGAAEVVEAAEELLQPTGELHETGEPQATPQPAEDEGPAAG